MSLYNDLNEVLTPYANKIKELNGSLSAISEEVDTLNNGGLELKDEVIQADIEAWLEMHPEATTTVQDGSLTYAKLVTGTMGFVTPEMFGAVGDGTTDDTTAFKAAVESGKPVILMGDYILSPIEIETAVDVTIYGNGHTININPESSSNYLITYDIDDHIHDVSLYDLKVLGTSAESGTRGFAWLQNVRIINIEKCYFKDISTPATTMEGIDIIHGVDYYKMTVKDSTFDGARFRCLQCSGKYTYVDGCYFTNCCSGLSSNNSYIEYYYSEKIYVTNCVFEACTMVGISCENSDSKSTKEGFAYFSNNVLEDIGNLPNASWTYGICIGNGFYGVVENNSLHNISMEYEGTLYGHGITIGNNKGTTHSSVVKNNSVSNVLHNGIYVQTESGQPMIIAGNSVKSCGVGIYSAGSKTESIISDNFISDCVTGIHARNRVTIASNRLNSIENDIYVRNTVNTLITDNVFMSTTLTGYCIYTGDTPNLGELFIKGNRFKSTKIINYITSITNMTNFECNKAIVTIYCSYFNAENQLTETVGITSKVYDTINGMVYIKTNTGLKALQTA